MKKKKIFFMHIPKCAGTSILQQLRLFYGENLIEVYQEEAFKNKEANIAKAKVIFGHFGTSYYSDYHGPKTLATVLRDPVDRMLSHYSYWKSGSLAHIAPSSRASAGPDAAKILSLLDFLKSKQKPINYQIENIQAWMLISDYRKKDRLKYSTYSRNRLAEIALQNLETFDFIGLTENLSESNAALYDALGLPSVDQSNKHNIPRMNETENRITVANLTDEERNIIYQLTDLDRIVYDRAKQLSNNR